ncbi:hypothetical protein [Desulfoluna spongiiphila]|uniref:Uncharacterized protein n=1 Tax=Desulfoluna spongiiphila TaxID=419481 RepID=A0A1G5EHX6_9BACT|nr:hypothetical protein [Desulfoluna spongiiphila]SCY26565.1 hypothetical protein SAMN05216233_10628 [Desulfoluna spongiiphila]VVS91137.1 hypothetical protein DBB_7050 [Desulfoluna spongiiphila]
MAGLAYRLTKGYLTWISPATPRAVRLRNALCFLLLIAWAPFGVAVLFLFDAPGSESDPIAWIMAGFVWLYPLLFLISLPLTWLALRAQHIHRAAKRATLPLWYAKAMVMTGVGFYLALNK